MVGYDSCVELSACVTSEVIIYYFMLSVLMKWTSIVTVFWNRADLLTPRVVQPLTGPV